MAVLKVSDQGIGISKENQERIFQRFERAISANEVSGLGLGLYIVRQILEMHRGSIEVKSHLGKGSTFIVKLPIES
jgi:signal transduction histidine kinase